MTGRDDIGYYRQREMGERELAAKAQHPQAARIHLELADSYAGRADAAVRRPTLHIAS